MIRKGGPDMEPPLVGFFTPGAFLLIVVIIWAIALFLLPFFVAGMNNKLGRMENLLKEILSAHKQKS
jgi:hypothetical protein